MEVISKFLNAGYSFEDAFRAIVSPDEFEDLFDEPHYAMQCDYEDFVDAYDEEEELEECYASDEDEDYDDALDED